MVEVKLFNVLICRPDLVNIPAPLRDQLSIGHPLIVILDSQHGNNREREAERLRQYLAQEWVMKESRKYRGERPDFSAQSIQALHPPHLPVQPNGNDCGVYTCEFFERTLDR